MKTFQGTEVHVAYNDVVPQRFLVQSVGQPGKQLPSACNSRGYGSKGIPIPSQTSVFDPLFLPRKNRWPEFKIIPYLFAPSPGFKKPKQKDQASRQLC